MWNGTKWTKTTHIWGDKDFDWKGLNEAGSYISNRIAPEPFDCQKEDQVWVDWKEKWGQLVLTPHGPFDEKLYGLAYKEALEKWPHLHDEILDDAYYPEYIEGYKINYVYKPEDDDEYF